MNCPQTKKVLKKITKERLRNIGLFYIERFETSVQNLKDVLKRRVDRYAFENKDFDRQSAYQWIDEILVEFEDKNYVSDKRFSNIKIEHYLEAGKSKRYIQNKLKSKGVDEQTIYEILDTKEIDEYQTAINFAKKKKIGPFRDNILIRQENRQKDMMVLVRAGFDYDIVREILALETVN